MRTNITVLVVDDHKVVRDNLRVLIEREGMIVSGEAGDGYSAIELARTTMPDLIIMDLTMPNMGGIEATQHILKESPGIKVLALSVHKDHRFVDGALGAGASGYLVKESAYDELLAAIDHVMKDGVYVSKALRGGVGATE